MSISQLCQLCELCQLAFTALWCGQFLPIEIPQAPGPADRTINNNILV